VEPRKEEYNYILCVREFGALDFLLFCARELSRLKFYIVLRNRVTTL